MRFKFCPINQFKKGYLFEGKTNKNLRFRIHIRNRIGTYFSDTKQVVVQIPKL